MTQIDFLAIGDMATDAFIKIHQVDMHSNVDVKDNKLCFDFGSKVPYDSVDVVVATGNSANAVISAERLGLKSAIFTYIGDDQNGKDCLEELQKNNVDTEFVHIEKDKSTNYHFVLWYGVDRTILVRHESFNYKFEDVGKPKWIYLSSVGDSAISFHNQIADFIEKNPEIKLAFQPGTFQIKTGKETLSRIYQNSEIFFCNVEEAQTILSSDSRDLPSLLKAVAMLGPKKVVITDGISGAYAYDGTTIWFIPSYPGEPFERTGAGDAFASTIVSALAHGKPFEEALLWGPINSMSVVKYTGALKGLLTETQLQEYMNKAPESYKLRKI